MFPQRPEPEYRSRQLRGTSWRCRLRAEATDACGLSALDTMVVQIDGIYNSEQLELVAALGIDSEGSSTRLG